MILTILAGQTAAILAWDAAGANRAYAEAQVSHTEAPPTIAFSNPVVNHDAPDPDVVSIGGEYYLFTTSSMGENIPVYESSDMIHWQPMGDALPALPYWQGPLHSWAPGVFFIDGQFVMFYASLQASTGLECISEATSAIVTGPYNDPSSAPLICQASQGGSIDPQPFVNSDGVAYLYWKSNNGLQGVPAEIWVARLTPNGLGLASAPLPILTQTLPWESTVEAPFMYLNDGAYYLFYSGGLWSTPGYSVGYAVCSGPEGPCSKPQAEPIISSVPGMLGPGGESIFQDSYGRSWIAFHAWPGPTTSYGDGGYRALYIEQLEFVDGAPVAVAPPSPNLADSGYLMATADGSIFAGGDANNLGQLWPAPPSGPIAGLAVANGGSGYWLVDSQGTVYPYGTAQSFPPLAGISLHTPIVSVTATLDGKGYWLASADGYVYAYGDAVSYGSPGYLHLNGRIVGMTMTSDGKGYWLVGSDGGIFSYGDAQFFGSTGALELNKPVVGVSPTPDGKGYWLVASDGGIFAFGDAGFYGSTGNLTLNKPVLSMSATKDGKGYWMVASDGGIFAFGDAPFYGSTGATLLESPVVAMATVSQSPSGSA